MSEYRPIYNSSGEVIPTKKTIDIANVFEILNGAGFSFDHQAGYSIIINKHGNPVSDPIESDQFITYVYGMVCGMAQPSKCQECVKAYLVKHE